MFHEQGGKSTLLRQTCLITILSQIGSWVPAEKCSITPIDRIFTRLGASDRLLLGQSTFFVELAETGMALRGASRRSLVIMDELGRGTSTFDGTAIASATVKHLVEQNKCIALFSTHYHTLLEEWKDDPRVRLGHMECMVDNESVDKEEHSQTQHITFLYTLGEGSCPRSFGINVARLAGLPDEVLSKARTISTRFETEMNGNWNDRTPAIAQGLSSMNVLDLKKDIQCAVNDEDWLKVREIWLKLQDTVPSG
jgi:DNA mismatch repair protein MSH6